MTLVDADLLSDGGATKDSDILNGSVPSSSEDE